jgi:1-acyl-sn-glycerol-3-phosphate acyltransferase
MRKLVDRGWRIVATGISFSLFGLGGLMLRVLVFPFLNLFIWDEERRTEAARSTIRLAFRAFIETMRVLGILRYDLRGLEKLERKGMLVLANHPTLIDVVFLVAFVKHAGCIVKSSLWKNPFTKGPVRSAGFINNSSGPELVEQCVAAIRAGSNLVVFPEGTRTPQDNVLSFKRGAANIAVRGRLNITPVVIRCEPRTLCKGEKWWQVPSRRFDFSMEVREDIPVGHFIDEAGNETLAARHLTDFLQNYFTEENNSHAVARTRSETADHRCASA